MARPYEDDDDYDGLMEAAAVGYDLEKQLRHKGAPICMILERARAEAAETLAQLVECDPQNSERIRALQERVKRYRDIHSWVHETVHDGHRAVDQMTGDDDHFDPHYTEDEDDGEAPHHEA